MDDAKLEELAEKMLAQPKEVEVDGQRVENQSVGDLLRVARYFASKDALSGRTTRSRSARKSSTGPITS